MSEDKVTASSNSTPVDIEGCAALYVELRDTIKKIEDEASEKVKPYRKGLADLDVILLKALQDQGAKSIRTEAGTISQRISRKATIKDKLAFQNFVKENDLFDLIDWKANAPAVFDYVADKQTDVPGVNTSAFMSIGVRRATPTQENDDE